MVTNKPIGVRIIRIYTITGRTTTTSLNVGPVVQLIENRDPIFEKYYDEFTMINMLIFERSYDDFMILSYAMTKL